MSSITLCPNCCTFPCVTQVASGSKWLLCSVVTQHSTNHRSIIIVNDPIIRNIRRFQRSPIAEAVDVERNNHELPACFRLETINEKEDNDNNNEDIAPSDYTQELSTTLQLPTGIPGRAHHAHSRPHASWLTDWAQRIHTRILDFVERTCLAIQLRRRHHRLGLRAAAQPNHNNAKYHRQIIS